MAKSIQECPKKRFSRHKASLIKQRFQKKRRRVFSESRIGESTESSSSPGCQAISPRKKIKSPAPLKNIKNLAYSKKLSMVNGNDPSPSLRKKAANKMNVLLSKKLNSLKKSKMANFKHKLKSLSPTKKMGIFSKNCRFEGVSSTIVKTLKRPSPKKKAISRRITIRQNVNSSKDVITKKFSVIEG